MNFAEAFKPFNREYFTSMPIFSGKFSRLFTILEDNIEYIVLSIANNGMGIGLATLIFAALVRIAFLPMQLLGIKSMYINRLISPDLKEFQVRIKRLRASQNTDLLIKETRKMEEFKKVHNLKGSNIRLAFTFFQGMTMFAWAGLMQKFTYKLEDYPQMINGGFFWFKDLSLSDPYFILPLINTMTITYNIYNNNATIGNDYFIRMRKFMFLVPLASFPIMTTLQSGLVLYIVSSSLIQAVITYFSNSKAAIRLLKLPENYLPNTKLEKLVSADKVIVNIIYFIQNSPSPIIVANITSEGNFSTKTFSQNQKQVKQNQQQAKSEEAAQTMPNEEKSINSKVNVDSEQSDKKAEMKAKMQKERAKTQEDKKKKIRRK